ncbi:unnamed protein product [Trichobilharzia regenti]|nr:unnamed protein product [Trichobilharzia regenti]
MSCHISLVSLSFSQFIKAYILLYKQFTSHFKVVLTLRDKNDWLSSLRETVLPKTNTPQKLMFDEMKTTFGLDKTFEKMVYDSMKFAFQKDIDLDNDEALLECFDEYNQRIKDTIPHERLLVHTFTDGWGPLCKFLNVDIPKDKPYPHVNDRNEMKSRMEVTRKQMS